MKLVQTEGVGTDLPDEAYKQPFGFEMIVSTKDFQSLMLARQGRIMAAGYLWKIVGKTLPASLVEIRLQRENPANA